MRASVWDRLSSLSVHGHIVALDKTDWTVCPAFRPQKISHGPSG